MDKKKNKALQDLPGAAVDAADGNADTEKLVKEDVRDLNNNPRNTDDKMP